MGGTRITYHLCSIGYTLWHGIHQGAKHRTRNIMFLLLKIYLHVLTPKVVHEPEGLIDINLVSKAHDD